MSEENKLDPIPPISQDGSVVSAVPGVATAPTKPKVKKLGDTPTSPDDHHAGSEPV
ncbi:MULTISPECIES: hypothetical protein [Streptomyces]|uniref:hypothetical protein n=1 Tax=Streptomyces TaxID=1883 RepID=UPI00163B8430|nr:MULTISPECIES: hypothetical protein [Streptomyces]MBC2875970.1 hypothetical protein [Streptomyces sp. TYQ1024]UBI38338.1 hypothetical protein K7I03_18985 [Streptomyces mobaraensis]UKW30922.1 hypothetical protein MCU78_18940 [Streptomyces sp. TYQ1024]